MEVQRNTDGDTPSILASASESDILKSNGLKMSNRHSLV